MSPSAPTAWVCHGCERQVPRHIDTCYCGARRPQEPAATRPSAQREILQPAVRFGLAVAAVALLGLGAWYSNRATPAAVVPAPAGRPQNAVRPPVTAVLAPAQPAADAAAPPLEDTIAHAMPAVVKVETASMRGSGFFAAPDLIVTNAHVMAGSQTAVVTTSGGRRVDARAVLVSESHDLALLQIPQQNALNVAIPLGQSSQARLGQGIVALGWAESMTQSTVTRGVVTGLRRDGERTLLQTDAVPNHGDSGGPLLDLRGNVLGITTFRADSASGSAGLAIAIDDAKPFFERVPPNSSPAATARAPIAAAAAPAAAAPSPASSALSPMDARRTIGRQHYEEALASIEMSAAQLDAGWKTYRTSCRITTVPGGQSHEWFALYDPRSPLHNTGANCADFLARIEQLARAVDASMSTANELARQSGVYAGELRTLRARRHLDYAAWDR